MNAWEALAWAYGGEVPACVDQINSFGPQWAPLHDAVKEGLLVAMGSAYPGGPSKKISYLFEIGEMHIDAPRDMTGPPHLEFYDLHFEIAYDEQPAKSHFRAVNETTNKDWLLAQYTKHADGWFGRAKELPSIKEDKDHRPRGVSIEKWNKVRDEYRKTQPPERLNRRN